jgi:hypothetical protein
MVKWQQWRWWCIQETVEDYFNRPGPVLSILRENNNTKVGEFIDEQLKERDHKETFQPYCCTTATSYS